MASSSDRSMDNALRAALRSSSGPASGCDAEMTAAYAEGRLKGPERLRFEAHLAQCTACRSMATTLLEEQPVRPEPVPLPRWSWNWRWVAPALAGVVIVGSVVIYHRAQVLRREPADARVAQFREAVRAKEAEPLKDTPPAPTEPRPAAQPPARRRLQPARNEKPVEELRRQGVVATAPLASTVTAERAARRDADVEQDKLEKKNVEAVSVAGAPAPPATPEVQQREGAKEKSAAAATLRERQSAGARASYAAGGMTQQLAQQQRVLLLPGGFPINGMTEHGGTLWAVSSGGRVFRSSDGGLTWQKLDSPTTADLVKIEWESEASVLLLRDSRGREYRLKP